METFDFEFHSIRHRLYLHRWILKLTYIGNAHIPTQPIPMWVNRTTTEQARWEMDADRFEDFVRALEMRSEMGWDDE